VEGGGTELDRGRTRVSQPRHKIPRSENQTKNIENWTESTESKYRNWIFHYLVWLLILRNQICWGNSVLYLRELNLPKYAEFECSYIINSTILIYYILYMWYSAHTIL
jgi:hypothetical protein